MKKITEKLLLSLDFEKEKVSAEESGDKPFQYFVFNLKNKRAILITCADIECIEKNQYSVEFFNEEDAGKIYDGEILEKLCEIIKNLK